jgi:hypothetical protein
MPTLFIDKLFYRNGDPNEGQRGFQLDDNLYSNLKNYLIPAVERKWDAIGLITGMEGSGKSTVAFTIAYTCDQSFDIDRIVFTPEQLLKAIDKAKPGQAIVFDEAVLGMMSQDASTQIQSVLIKKFVTIRKKRLFIFLVIPSIFLLRKYFAIFRTRFLLHTFSPDGINRGFFKFYGYTKKRQLYVRGLKEFDQGIVRDDFQGRFTDTAGFFFDQEEYEIKKDDAIHLLTSQFEGARRLTPMHLKMIAERDFLLILGYNLYKYNVETKNNLGSVQKRKAVSSSGFSRFIEKKYGYRITPQNINMSMNRGLSWLEQEIELKHQQQKFKEDFLGMKDDDSD